jgi:hypothetical protein
VVNKMRIGISGKANSGKNTLANEIAAVFDWEREDYEVLSFADPIKEMGEIMFPWVRGSSPVNRRSIGGWYGASYLRNTEVPRYDGIEKQDRLLLAIGDDGNFITYRDVLVALGTQGRKWDDNHWVWVYSHRMKQHTDKHIITPDIRFRNEYEWLHHPTRNYFLIRLKRDNSMIPSYIHSLLTETSQDDILDSEFDAVIENNGTLEELQAKIKALKPQILEHQKTEVKENPCQHNWVLDGHNTGESICSKCNALC